MAFERGGHWYKNRREGGRVVTEYIGSGELGRYTAEADNLKQQQRARERSELQALAAGERELDRQFDTLAAQLHSLTEAALLASGYHLHSGTWRRRRV